MAEAKLLSANKVVRVTAANTYISKFYYLAKKCGLDADALLLDAGISPDVIDTPGRRVEAEKLAEVLIGIWDALEDEAMALSDSPIPRGSFYMMGKLAIHEPDLRKAIEQFIRFYAMVTNAYTMQLSVDGETAKLTFDLNAPEKDDDHLLAEIHLMSLHRFSSWLIATNIPLSEIYFSYPAPPQVKEYSFLFPGKHVFEAPHMGFAFSSKYLDEDVVQDVGTLKTFMRQCPVELFLQPKTDFSLTSEVQSLLQKHIRDGFPNAGEVASHLHLTRRTLMRKLREEGSSFQQIKDLIRRDRAIYLLTSHHLAVGEIAQQVGFSDPAVFARAFKSWTGVSPRDYRSNFSAPRTLH